MTSTQDTLLVLISHGSRDPRWRKPFERLTAELQEQVGQKQPLALCYMEMAEPDLFTVVAKALQTHSKLTAVKIVPLFMAAGAHFAKDIKRLTEELREKHAQLNVITFPPVGEDPAMQALMKQLAEEALYSTVESAY